MRFVVVEFYLFVEYWFEFDGGVCLYYVDEGLSDGFVVFMVYGNLIWFFYWC